MSSEIISNSEEILSNKESNFNEDNNEQNVLIAKVK